MPALRRLAPLFLLLSMLTLLARPSAAAEVGTDGPAVIILDGSGSMWGNIGSERPAKIDLARGALRQSLSTLSPRVRLGLMSFGQRRRADCSDVEVLASPEAGPPERILSIADRLNPKGKGPLSLALKEAAKQIPAGEAGSIIAIHDGTDNCWQDPCAAASEIAKANPKTRVFLIGFGLEKPDIQRLACVARTTHGRVLDAQDSTRLTEAISEVLRLANLERVDPATGIAVPVPKAATPPAAASGPPGLRLSASHTANSPPLAAAVLWTIAKADQPNAPVKSVRTHDLAVDLAPGSYVVEARLGQAAARQTVEVASGGPTVAKLSLGAGLLKFSAQADKGGAALTLPLITISAKDGTHRRPVWIGRDPAAELVIPAGSYEVRVEDGLAAQTTEVTVTEGAQADVGPVLGTGRLELSAVAAATGEPLKEVTYTIEEDDPDSPQGRREVARSADPAASFTLPAGTYYVATRSGVAEMHDRIALGSGATVKHAATFNLVTITVMTATSTPPENNTVQLPPILIRVSSAGEPPREIARVTGTSGTFQLPPARYRVEALASGLNIKAQGLIDLSNGRGGSVQLKLDTAEVSVKGAAAGSHWRIKDRDGRTVMHSGPGEPATALLAPGRYVLLSEGAEQAFDLKAGERRELAVGRL